MMHRERLALPFYLEVCMFFLKCKISGYMLQSLALDKGVDCGTKSKSVFTLNAHEALNFESASDAIKLCGFFNKFSPAPLPYEFDGGTHTLLEVVELKTLNFESESQEG